MFISIERYGFSWLLRPVVAILLAMAVIGVVRPFLADVRRQGGIGKLLTSFQAPTFKPQQLFTMFFIALIAMLVASAAALGLRRQARADDRRHASRSWSPASACSTRCAASRPPRPACSLVDQAQAEVAQDPARRSTWISNPTPGTCRCAPSSTRSARFFGYLARLHGVDGVDRADPDGGDLRHRLHAAGRAGALEADHSLRGRAARSASTSPSTGSWRSPGRRPCSASWCRRPRSSPRCSSRSPIPARRPAVVRPRHTGQLCLGCQAIPQDYQQNSAARRGPARYQ